MAIMRTIKAWSVSHPLNRWPLAPLRRAGRWVRANHRTIRSADLGLALTVSLLTLGAALRWNQTREAAKELFIGGAALGAALLALALAAMSILVALLDSDYLMLLRASSKSSAEDGLRKAFRPYKVIAVVSAVALGCSGIGLALGAVLPWWANSITLAVVVGLSTWAVVGTVQLVNITARHGEMKGRLFHLKDQIRDKRAEAKHPDESADH